MPVLLVADTSASGTTRPQPYTHRAPLPSASPGQPLVSPLGLYLETCLFLWLPSRMALCCATGEGGFSRCSSGAKRIPAAVSACSGATCCRHRSRLPGLEPQLRLGWRGQHGNTHWSPPDPWLEEPGCLNQRNQVSSETLTPVGWCFNCERLSTPCVVLAGMDGGARLLLACELRGCCGWLPLLPTACLEQSSWEPSLGAPPIPSP